MEDKPDEKPEEKKKKVNLISYKSNLWNMYFCGKYNVKCPCCEIYDISKENYEAGHIIAESQGGVTKLGNLIPICQLCNKSMGIMNYHDFSGMITGNKEIDIKNIKKIIKLKIYIRTYGDLKNHKCIKCKDIQVEPIVCYYIMNDKTKPTYINNIIGVCSRCYKTDKGYKKILTYIPNKEKTEDCCCLIQ